MFELRGVSKIVDGATHLAPTSMVLEPGTINVLLGPTLAGKTTLLRLMAGLEKPTAGQVLFDGQDVTGVPVQKRGVAMVYQQFVNYPAMTVFENIASPLRVAGVKGGEVEARVREAADLLKLTPYLDRTPLTLSGGQQQRTALARAIVKGAKLVLLDEPLANLDYKLREELRAELPRIFARTGAILVYATTEPSEALLLGGNVATLHEGQVTQFGRAIEVFRGPQDLITARTVSDPPLNTIAARKSGAAFDIAGAKVPAPDIPDGDYVLGVQPHHVTLGGVGASLAATVSVSEITGSESFVHLDVAGSPWVALLTGVHDIEPGAKVTLAVDPRTLMVFSTDGKALAA